MSKDLIKELEHQIIHTTTAFKKDEEFEDPRFMKIRVAMLHSGVNRNKSRFSKECIENAKDTFANIPVLAEVAIHHDENGNEYLDYTTHAMHIETDAFGESEDDQRIIYDEKVVGIVPESNNFELILDEETGNYYVWLDALLYRDYGNYACDVLESRGGVTDVSAEISCDEISFSSKDKCMDVGKMTACAVTLLGADVTPGMAKAHATTFSISDDSKQEQLIKIMQELKESLDNYTKSQKKGGNSEVNTETEKFEDEVFDETVETTEEVVEETTEEEAVETDETVETDEAPEDVVENETVAEFSELIRTFKISHEDIRYALYALIAQYEELDQDYIDIISVYDDSFIMYGYFSGHYYGQKYIKDGDNVALDGERYALYAEFVTETEKAQLDSMRSNYAEISEKAAKYDYSVLEAERMAEFSKPDYSSISDKSEFVELAKEENHKDFSLEEVKTKLNEIILSYAKAGQLNFANTTNAAKKTISVTRLPIESNSQKRSRYGNLFSKTE